MNNTEKLEIIKKAAENYIKLLKHTQEYKNILIEALSSVGTEFDNMKVEGGSFSWKVDKGRKYISTSLLNNYFESLLFDAKAQNNIEVIPEAVEMQSEIEKNCTKIIAPKMRLKVKLEE